MNARDQILQAIREGKPDFLPLPTPVDFPAPSIAKAEQFSVVLTNIGGHLVKVRTMEEVEAYVRQHYDLSLPVVSLVPEVPVGNVMPIPTDDPHQFADLHLVLLQGQLGVAENGAIWIDEQNFTLRVLPFITLNLAIVIRQDQLVAHMHEAYRQLRTMSGYGTFIAGPSKTADIEQSLVIGAHGPKSMTVFLVGA